MQFNNLTNKQFNFIVVCIVLIASLCISCERDDICIDPTTPDLVIRFYDKDEPTETKSAAGVIIKIEGTVNEETEFLVSSDSIAVPIRVTDNITNYLLTKLVNGESQTDTWSLNYTREEIFVGRSCGYKTIFNNATVTNQTDNWISSIEITSPLNIEDETEAHIKIFH